jgi:hypothetical protein
LLSDDALWAFSEQANGPLDPTLFSIALPQRLVLRSPRQLLESLSINNTDNTTTHVDINWGETLPLGTSIVSLLKALVREDDISSTSEQTVVSSLKSNTLVRLLSKIPSEEMQRLRGNAYAVSHLFRFYSLNTSLAHSAPPLTATSTFPTGGAVAMLDQFLMDRKREGSFALWEQCLVCYNTQSLVNMLSTL